MSAPVAAYATENPPAIPLAPVPEAVKWAYTAFMAVLVPTYWYNYGPTNFLYFCDVALFLTLATIWTGRPLFAGMAAVGILLPQLLWAADFVVAACGGTLTGMTAYMFAETNPLFNRSLSLFHGWLPFLLLWIVSRVGYDRRSIVAWWSLAWGLMVLSWLFLPAPPVPADDPNLPVNINYVYGPSDAASQEWMHPLAWLGFVMTAFPAVFWAPTHFALRSYFPQPADVGK
jgi:hypothetical protein